MFNKKDCIMKKFWLILGLALFAFVMTACQKSKFELENPDEYFEQFIHGKQLRYLPEHWFFEDNIRNGDIGYRANSCTISFLDEHGNNLINIDDRSTWPVPCCKDKYVVDPDSYYDDFSLGISQGGAYLLFAAVDGRHIMTYPLRFRGRDYEMRFEYLYTNESVVGGSGMYAKIFRCKFEGRFIFSDFENPQKNKIIVILDKDGDIVSLQRE